MAELRSEERLQRLSASMLALRHSGFSVHNGVRFRAGDTVGRKQLAQ